MVGGGPSDSPCPPARAMHPHGPRAEALAESISLMKLPVRGVDGTALFPRRTCPPWHDLLLQVVHTPFLVVVPPLRYWLVGHVGCLLHLYPLVVPEHVPLRYWELAHLR